MKCEHLSQTIPPQRRQWWRLRVTVKVRAQVGHIGTSASWTQGTTVFSNAARKKKKGDEKNFFSSPCFVLHQISTHCNIGQALNK